MENEKPGYYALITANVRYDDSLSLLERLLYAEITALLNKKGYCFATNDYFAKLYKRNKSTISRCISNLQEHGYIKVFLIRNAKKEVVERRIYCVEKMPEIDLEEGQNAENVNTPIAENINTPTDKNSKGIITRDYQYKNLPNECAKRVNECAEREPFEGFHEKEVPYEIPTPRQVHDYYLKKRLAVKPWTFWNDNEKKGWRIKGKPIYDWKSAYLGMNKSDPDAYLKHEPGLEFDLSDYKPKKG